MIPHSRELDLAGVTSASVNRTPSETSPDRDIVTSPPDMDRNNPTRVRARDRGGKCQVIIELNAILLKSARVAST